MEKITLQNFKTKTPSECEEWLISHGYIYNRTFGWERIEIIERFNLNPDMTGVPCTLKYKWDEIDGGNKTVRDEFGNSIRVKLTAGWKRSETEKEWQISDNWLAYMNFKKNRNISYEIQAKNPKPNENYYTGLN